MIHRTICIATTLVALASFASAKTTESNTTNRRADALATRTADAKSTISAEIQKADGKGGRISGETALIIPITGELRERGDAFLLFGQPTQSLKDYLDLIRKAREDKDVKTIVFRFTSAQIGMAMAQELRGAIAELRERGKKTIGIVEDDSQVSYLVSTACDQVVLPPSGDLMLYGVKADAYFVKNLLDKIGVSVDIVHIGQYKSFGEMFTHDEFTSPAQQNMQEIVDDTYTQMAGMIAKSRDMTPDKAANIINGGPLGAEDAKRAGLVDEVAYASDVLKQLEKKGATLKESSDYQDDGHEKMEDFSLLNLFSLMKPNNKSTSEDDKYPRVAVLYAVGPISLGSAENSVLGSEERIASEDFIETLDDIQNDGKIKAVILRVNSPGGSAFASDLIWKKIEEVKKVKPVVASMSDVAASGGYYIAMGANKIIAQEGTMTGSIGVVGGKPNLSGVYQKLGITKRTISKGDYAGLFSETANFSPQERQLIERMMRKTYTEFVAKAAAGRHMAPEKLQEVAQGRVWTGMRAKEVGLVDDIGGMPRAIQEVKNLMGLTKDEKVALVSYPREQRLLDFLQKAIGGNVTAHMKSADPLTLMPHGVVQVLRTAKAFGEAFQREHVLAIMPVLPVME